MKRLIHVFVITLMSACNPGENKSDILKVLNRDFEIKNEFAQSLHANILSMADDPSRYSRIRKQRIIDSIVWDGYLSVSRNEFDAGIKKIDSAYALYFSKKWKGAFVRKDSFESVPLDDSIPITMFKNLYLCSVVDLLQELNNQLPVFSDHLGSEINIMMPISQYYLEGNTLSFNAFPVIYDTRRYIYNCSIFTDGKLLKKLQLKNNL